MILGREAQEEDLPTDVDKLLDRVIAPIMYRILFTDAPPGREYAQELLDRALETGHLRPVKRHKQDSWPR
ncbi:hypothetical protein ABWH97_09165 [Nitratireductor sp. ac15]|uniref:hypothetical protein n=1 Tax=Nitratireductor sp. L15S-10 TaxID=3034028 RepID=UPI00385738DF